MNAAAPDRYRYFRVEARELLDALGGGILELEKTPLDRSVVARILRHAHTLKGAARIVQQQIIGELAHAIEDALAPHREPSSVAVPREAIDELLRLVDAIGNAVAVIGAPAEAPDLHAVERRADEPVAAERADRSDLERLFEAVLEAAVQAAGLRNRLPQLEHATQVARLVAEQLQAPLANGATSAQLMRIRSLADDLRRALEGSERALATGVNQIAREIADVRDAAERLRLLPARALAAPLERAARDAARALERDVTFEMDGTDVRLDATILGQLRGALQHVVRNAVTHGIEAPGERQRLGKPARGRVRLSVERRGRLVAFVCSDDGRGVDLEGVRSAAIAKGRIGADEAAHVPAAHVLKMLLRGGLSTAASVTEISGRGVGLDVLRDTAARLGAEVNLASEPGRGTTVEITVPISLASLGVLHVEAAGTVVSIPLAAVEETLHLPAGDVARTAGDAAIAHRGALVPFRRLVDVLGLEAPARARRSWSAVVVRAGGSVAALGTDRLLGTSEVVMHPLPAFVAADPAIAGASLDAEGHPRLVLDPLGAIAASARSRREDAPLPERAPLLVVDDSLTTRMLEQSILESAGYAVELAASAEEALGKCRSRRYALFLVDVEMPGMDGFEFVRLTRADPRLSGIPAILVTSRSSAEDRARGAAVGAAHYMVKSEFDQGRLLGTIRELVG